MREFGVHLLLTLSICGAAAAQVVAPTAFEQFATDPDTAIATSQVTGSLASADATVEAAVLLAEARSDSARRMRGVRFELRNAGGAERVYLDERQLAKLKTEVILLERSPQPATTGRRIQGTESCWMPDPVQRILCPEMQMSPEFNGLRLWTFGGARFDFRDRSLTELRELLERTDAALAEL